MKETEKIAKVFVAEDGTEFDTEDACKEYENKAEERKRHKEELDRALKAISRIKSKDGECMPPTTETEFCENHYFDWYKPRTEEDIAALNLVYYGGGEVLTMDSVNQWICVEHTHDVTDERCRSDYYDNYYTFLSDCMKYVDSLFNVLGYDVTFTERSSETAA